MGKTLNKLIKNFGWIVIVLGVAVFAWACVVGYWLSVEYTSLGLKALLANTATKEACYMVISRAAGGIITIIIGGTLVAIAGRSSK